MQLPRRAAAGADLRISCIHHVQQTRKRQHVAAVPAEAGALLQHQPRGRGNSHWCSLLLRLLRESAGAGSAGTGSMQRVLRQDAGNCNTRRHRLPLLPLSLPLALPQAHLSRRCTGRSTRPPSTSADSAPRPAIRRCS